MTSKRLIPVLASAVLLTALAACKPEDPYKGIGPEAKTEALKIFAERCTPCHGAGGQGDGPGSKGLTPPPRNFTDPKWQSDVTDEHLERIIQFGGAAVAKSPAMPPNPDLMSKPEVVSALRAHVRSLKRP